MQLAKLCNPALREREATALGPEGRIAVKLYYGDEDISGANSTAKSGTATMSPEARERQLEVLFEVAIMDRACRNGHPNLVHLVGWCAQPLAIFMKHYARGTLHHMLQGSQSVKWGPEVAIRWAKEIACGLGELHRLGIVHLDVKPLNVLLDITEEANDVTVVAAPEEDSEKTTVWNQGIGAPKLRCVISDFGSCVLVGASLSSSRLVRGLAQPNFAAFTGAYAAPEVCHF